MSKISKNAPNLLDADIQVLVECERKTYEMEWYTSLINFLSGLNGAKNVTIFSGYEKALIIPKELRENYPSHLPDVKHLKTYGSGKSTNERIEALIEDEIKQKVVKEQ
ncbi:hypothetical protein PanWU01x14_254480 [Parasponia andersonii]|uniref:Uncharacterized protein n=1 Tax=Parasponia andersonii TaxID=3476 RepID=A0A2P5BB74_PARAD|nr:hypothetical protein PanWU01x14_254480 [Parasponia andersonii]